MNTILYRVSTAALVFSLAAPGAWAQSSANGSNEPMMSGSGAVGKMGNTTGPAGMMGNGGGTRSSPSGANSQTEGISRGGYGPWAMGPWMRGSGMTNGTWMGPQMMGWGGGYGPWMMGPGMMGGGWMGPQMMGWSGRGGYGPWMMGPQMMGGGWMGPQMMGWGGDYGGYGRCGGAIGGAQRANLDLSVAQVQSKLERFLALGGNQHIKLGTVVEKNADTITADIVTTDNGGLVQRFEVDRRTGFIEPEGE